MRAEDGTTGEINPGTVFPDPDYSEESWEEMEWWDYRSVIENAAGDHERIAEALRLMPPDTAAEYAAHGYPGLPDDLRDFYKENGYV